MKQIVIIIDRTKQILKCAKEEFNIFLWEMVQKL